MPKIIPLSLGDIRPKDIERFWSKVEVREGDDCWHWTANKNWRGYGRFWIGRGNFQSHRFSWIIHYGDIPNGFHVLHTCDQRGCCNPRHLFLGTNDDNIRDREAKGRGKVPNHKGKENSLAKLTEVDVIAIRQRYAGGETQKAIAREYGIYQSAVSKIVLRYNWKHI